jgi:hypothetical protein
MLLPSRRAAWEKGYRAERRRRVVDRVEGDRKVADVAPISASATR